MDKLFLSGALKSFLKPRILVTDGVTFRLHYRLTALLLTACSLLVSATQFYGDPMQCIQTDDVPIKVLNTYCWVEGTFTLPKALDKDVGKEVVYAGVDRRDPEDDVLYHAYYQWVCFVLLLQAAFFYVPRLIWRSWENGRLKTLLQELHLPAVSLCQRKERCDHLVTYFRSNMRHHSGYAYKYMLCEVLNWINVTGQIWFMDYFLGGEFSTYGWRVVLFATGNQVGRLDPMVKVFPRLTKCTFHRFGPSGDVQKYDALCLLPLNVVNEKIYIHLWFWFIALTLLTSVSLLYKMALVSFRDIRLLALRSSARLTPRDQLTTIVRKTSYGDWFVLYLLAVNMDTIPYKDFLSDLYRDLKKNSAGNSELEALNT